MSVLKKYLLGADSHHGPGLGIYAPSTPRKLSDDTPFQQGSSILRELGPSPNSEAAFQRSLQILRDPAPLPPPSRDLASGQRSPISHEASASGVRAPRSSKATEILSSSPEAAPSPHSSRASGGRNALALVSETLFEPTSPPRPPPWRDLPIPAELGLVDDDLPLEIRDIVHDTLDLHRAMQLSRLQASPVELADDRQSFPVVESDALGPLPDQCEVQAHINRDRTSRSKGLFNLFQRHRARSGTFAPDIPKPKFPPSRCIGCYEEIPHEQVVYGLVCKHRYCRPCFAKLATSSHFPPTCCSTIIPTPIIRRHLSQDTREQFDAQCLEHAVPADKRLYCHNAACARWLDPRRGLRCLHCGTNAFVSVGAGTAVEAADHQLQRERSVEEEREAKRLDQEMGELELQETKRVDRINERYAELRAVLDHVGLQQRQAIKKRQNAQHKLNCDRRDHFDEFVAQRKRHISEEREATLVRVEESLRQLQQRHASIVLETMQRHRRDQERLISSLSDGGLADGKSDDTESGKMWRTQTLETLLPLQEAEKATLEAQQARELEKWRSRSQRLHAAAMPDIRSQEREQLTTAMDMHQQQCEADQRWFDVVHGERAKTLAEDETRLILGGRDVQRPSSSSHADVASLSSADLEAASTPSASGAEGHDGQVG